MSCKNITPSQSIQQKKKNTFNIFHHVYIMIMSKLNPVYRNYYFKVKQQELNFLTRRKCICIHETLKTTCKPTF